MIQPLTAKSQGIYQCAVKSEYIPTYPSSRSIYYSNKWNTNSGLPNYIPSGSAQYTVTPYSDGQSSIGSFSYSAQCQVSLNPSNTNYNVTFRMGARMVLGEFIVVRKFYYGFLKERNCNNKFLSNFRRTTTHNLSKH